MVLIWIIVLQILVFAVLAYFLKVTLSKNVSQATSHLTEINQDFNVKLDEANKKKIEIEKYYDEMILKAKSEAEKTKMQILREAHDTREEMIREARKQSGEIIEQANRSRESFESFPSHFHTGDHAMIFSEMAGMHARANDQRIDSRAKRTKEIGTNTLGMQLMEPVTVDQSPAG